MKFRGIKGRMIFSIGSVVVLGLGCLIAIVAYRTGRSASEQGIAQAQAIARSEANEFEFMLNEAVFNVRGVATAFSSVIEADHKLDRDSAIAMLKATLKSSPNFFGAWTCWEPNAFDGRDSEFAGTEGHDTTGRFVAYAFRQNGGIGLEPLRDYDSQGAEGEYYQLARKSGREIIMEPYYYEAGGKKIMMTSIVVPVKIGGKVAGAVGIDIDLQAIAEANKDKKIMDTGYAAVFSHKGLYAAHPNLERLGKAGVEHDAWLEPKLGELAAGKEFLVSTYSKTLNDTVFRIAAPVTIGDTSTPWSTIVSIQEGRVLAEARSARNLAIVIGSITVVAVLSIVLIISGRIANPIRVVASELQQGAQQTTSASGEISTASQSLASSASEQAASLEETSASLEELSSMTKRNADSARQARSLADTTRTSAETGTQHMQGMVTAMTSIKTSSDSVAKIIKTIDEIAFQTNILALNAAVEAARAGEAGAGFAVVAEEVRNLAQRSATAARETSDQISDALQRANHGVEICGRVAGSFEDILGKTRDLNTLVAEIATASEEQTRGIEQISTAVAQMDKTTQSTAAQSEETASAAQQLSSQAVQLESIAEKLFTLVEGTSNKSAHATEIRTPVLPAKKRARASAPAADDAAFVNAG